MNFPTENCRKEAQRCYCEATNCRGWIGGEPDSDEEIDDEDEEEESDEEERTTEGSEVNDAKSSTIGNDDASLVKESSVQKKAKAAPKPKKPKDLTKKPARKERAKATRKIPKDFKKRMKRSEIMEDPDLDKEIDRLAVNGLKNQVHTLQFSRLMGKSKPSSSSEESVAIRNILSHVSLVFSARQTSEGQESFAGTAA